MLEEAHLFINLDEPRPFLSILRATINAKHPNKYQLTLITASNITNDLRVHCSIVLTVSYVSQYDKASLLSQLHFYYSDTHDRHIHTIYVY